MHRCGSAITKGKIAVVKEILFGHGRGGTICKYDEGFTIVAFTNHGLAGGSGIQTGIILRNKGTDHLAFGVFLFGREE